MNSDLWNKNALHPMQTTYWGDFRKKMGNKVSLVFSGEKYFQIIWSRMYFLPLWFGYIPMGPVPNSKNIEDLINESKQMRAIGIRMEPNSTKNYISELKLKSVLRGRSLFRPSTLVIDLTRSEEEIYQGMSSKCRYNIRLSKRHGVTIEQNNNEVEEYIRLMFGKTTQRQGIYSHTENYHREMCKLPFAKLFVARHEEKVIASWVIFIWNKIAYYAYGAFDEQYRHTMAAVLGMSEIAMWAKNKGCETLDLWGNDEKKGYSRFKEQFGPKTIELAGSWDIVVNPVLYLLFRIAEEARWKILRILK